MIVNTVNNFYVDVVLNGFRSDVVKQFITDGFMQNRFTVFCRPNQMNIQRNVITHVLFIFSIGVDLQLKERFNTNSVPYCVTFP